MGMVSRNRLPRRSAWSRTVSSPKQLLAQAKEQGLDVVGPDGGADRLTKKVLLRGERQRAARGAFSSNSEYHCATEKKS